MPVTKSKMCWVFYKQFNLNFWVAYIHVSNSFFFFFSYITSSYLGIPLYFMSSFPQFPFTGWAPISEWQERNTMISFSAYQSLKRGKSIVKPTTLYLKTYLLYSWWAVINKCGPESNYMVLNLNTRPQFSHLQNEDNNCATL